MDFFMPMFYRRVYPKATHAEIGAFLWNSYSQHLPTQSGQKLNFGSLQSGLQRAQTQLYN
jgi:hypothetical protein